MKIKKHPLFLFIMMFLMISCGSPTGTTTSHKFAGVPSGEIVPVEQRDLVLTGIDSANKNKESTGGQNGQKWWKQIISKMTYNGCPGYEDEDLTVENIYFGFKPDGTLSVKQGENGREIKSTTWKWTDENKSAIIVGIFPDLKFELTSLNNDEIVYASVQPQEQGCEVITWEQFGEPLIDTTDSSDEGEDENDEGPEDDWNSGDDNDDDSENPYEGVPTGEIVSKDQRFETLTGYNENFTADTLKWWLSYAYRIKFTGCSEEYEDIDLTEENTYIAFTPDGTVLFKRGINGEPSPRSSWKWANEEKTALVMDYSEEEFEFTALNDEEVVYAHSEEDFEGNVGCNVVVWEHLTESH